MGIIKNINNTSGIQKWCFLGNFNSIRTMKERRGCHNTTMGEWRSKSLTCSMFIEEMEVEDIPLVGMKYTWFRSNGQAKIRLDRFLVSNTWLDQWSRCIQFV